MVYSFNFFQLKILCIFQISPSVSLAPTVKFSVFINLIISPEDQNLGNLREFHQPPVISSLSLSFSWGRVRLSPLGTSATNRPIVPAPDDRWWWMWSSLCNGNKQGKPKYSEKIYRSATLSTTIPTWPDLGSNKGRRGGKPATNRLRYGTAFSSLLVQIFPSVLLFSNTLSCKHSGPYISSWWTLSTFPTQHKLETVHNAVDRLISVLQSFSTKRLAISNRYKVLYHHTMN
jgi:hypothetical protein